MIGKTLAHYEILELIGQGGMGEVYRARDAKLGREVALKILPEELAKSPERRKRFEREAQAIATLKHPNIVTVYSVEEADGIPFLTMELVEGQSLSEIVPDYGLSIARFFELSLPLTEALGNAHASGIAHRDLKPDNVKLDRDGRVKVLDFGLAKLMAPGPDLEGRTMAMQESVTQEGRILGTVAYMSPEQAEGKPIDQRSDVFSLGIVLYEMATGSRPFTGDTGISTISSILKDTPPNVTEIRGNLPRHLGRIIGRCLEKDPDRRYQTAHDVQLELEGLKREIDSGELAVASHQPVSTAGMSTAGVSSAGVSSLSAPNAPLDSSAKSRPVWPWIALGLAIALVVVVWRSMGTSRDEIGGTSVATEGSSALGEATSSEATIRTAGRDDERAAGPIDDRTMIVVLPFENLGPPEDAYFAAGVTEEITSRLATVRELGVISRTSAVQVDRTGKTLKQVGEDLDVSYVLEGTVRWAKTSDGTGRVRINAQLIRVADDTHVWTQTYDREIDDIFDVQSEIAQQATEQLGVTLLGSSHDAIAQHDTESIEALQAYLRAQEPPGEMDLGETDLYTIENLQRAIELDPMFLKAWALLSTHHSSWYFLRFDRTDARLQRARDALDRLEGIAPDHPRTRQARGYYLYFGFNDFDGALSEFSAALEALPNDSELREAIGYIHRRKGNWDESEAYLASALKLDPRDANIVNNMADLYGAQRRFEDALRMRDRAIALAPTASQYVFSKASDVVAWNGDVAAAERIMDACPPGPFYYLGGSTVRLWRRDYDGALQYLSGAPDPTDPYVRAGLASFRAILLDLRDGPEAAREDVAAAIELMRESLAEAPGNSDFREWLAQLYAVSGDHEGAVREAKLAVDLTAKDMFAGPSALENLAAVYGWTGQTRKAVELLERLLRTTYQDAITLSSLEIDPMWDPLREDPGFQALLVPPSP